MVFFPSRAVHREVAIASKRHECTNMPSSFTSKSGPPVGRNVPGLSQNDLGRFPSAARCRRSSSSVRTIITGQWASSGNQYGSAA
eukprot:5045770-Prorocentrum_lima.AAC.1